MSIVYCTSRFPPLTISISCYYALDEKGSSHDISNTLGTVD